MMGKLLGGRFFTCPAKRFDRRVIPAVGIAGVGKVPNAQRGFQGDLVGFDPKGATKIDGFFRYERIFWRRFASERRTPLRFAV
jgi:hypothetical protein